MRNILSKVVIMLLLVSVVTPLIPAGTEVQQLSTEQMQNISGGKEQIDCDLMASGATSVCVMLGGGWLTCAIVAAAAYLGCLGANAITA
jgi:bacteriocin-like protein